MPEQDPTEPTRVVVTGLGAVTAAGPSRADLWTALLESRTCATPLTSFDVGRPAVAAQVDDYRGPSGVPDRFLERLSRPGQFALDAAIEAIADAQIAFNAENAYSVAAISGIAHGSSARGESGWPFLSSGISGATIGLKIAGPAYNVAADAASGLEAIITAMQLIRLGVVHAAVAVGAEAPLAPEVWAAYDAAGLLSQTAEPDGQRPFDRRRDGIVLGEGAGALLLEDRRVATTRGARIYAELAGAAQTSGPSGDGRAPTDVDIARRAIGDALRNADRSPQEADVVIAAGTGTLEGDKRETDILERSFGSGIHDMYVTSVTPTVGYTVGAAGALAAVAAAMTLSEGTVFPHASYGEADPECGLDVSVRPQDDHLHGAIVPAYGALGQNAAIFLMKHQAEAGDEIPVAL